MRDNLRELGIKQEATPGTVETITASDLIVRTREGDTFAPDIDIFETLEVQGVSSKRPVLTGRELFDATISHILRGPASLSVAPAISPLILAAMFIEKAITSSAIGTVSGGPFVDGETITGGTSMETATVFRDTADGASEIKYYDESGPFGASEVLTGGTSGATATTTGAPGADGHAYLPADSDFGAGDTKHHVTAEINRGGLFLRGRGCLANLQMQFDVGRPVVATQRLLGALHAHGDLALKKPASYPEESNAAPLFLAAALTIDGFTPTDIRGMTLNVETNPEAREDANAAAGANGVRFADYQKDAPTITVDPAQVSAATKDFLQSLKDADTFAMSWQVGSTNGQIWEFFADEAQITSYDWSNERDLATSPLELRLNSKKNQEVVIYKR